MATKKEAIYNITYFIFIQSSQTDINKSYISKTQNKFDKYCNELEYFSISDFY